MNSSAKRHCFMGGFRKTPPEPKQASMHLVLFPHRVAHASQSRRILEMRKCIKSCNLIDHHVLICTQKKYDKQGFTVHKSTNPSGFSSLHHSCVSHCKMEVLLRLKSRTRPRQRYRNSDNGQCLAALEEILKTLQKRFCPMTLLS